MKHYTKVRKGNIHRPTRAHTLKTSYQRSREKIKVRKEIKDVA